MGIALNAVHLLASTLPVLGNRSSKTMLTLGVQDCYFTYSEVVQFLNRHRIPFESLESCDRKLTTGFQWVPSGEKAKYRNYVHQATLFHLLGFRPENVLSMDVSDYESPDIVHDLNRPVDRSLHDRFDFIFDGGTVEHVFSIKDALFNICQMCKIGGVVVNFGPVDWINHGFVNLSAELLRDFYASNGFEELTLKYIVTPKHPRKANRYYVEYAPEQYQFSLSPYYHTGVYSAFRRIEEKPLTVPTQGAYCRLHAGARVPEWSRGWFRTMLSSTVVSSVDAHFISALLVRSCLNRLKGRRVAL